MKPTKKEFESALEEAERLRGSGDLHYLAKTLQYLQDRCEHLEQVFVIADRYLHFGQEEREHAELLKAIDAAKQAEAHDAGSDEEELGLN